MTRAQWVFACFLGATVILITSFTLFVAWTTVWGNRWYRRQK